MNIESLRRVPEALDRDGLLRVLQERKANMADLARQLGNPKKLFYPAGRSDMQPVLLPSVGVMAIVDIVPFLFSDAGPKMYSRIIPDILERNNGYVGFSALLEDPSMTDAAKEELERRVQSSFAYFHNPSVDRGFHIGTRSDKSQVSYDIFPDVIADLLFYGVDMSTLQLGKFGDDYRIQFDVDGKRKTVIFNNTQIEREFSKEGSSTYNWIQHCFDGYTGSTALVVKADRLKVSGNVVAAVNPDIMFGDESMLTTGDAVQGKYKFDPIDKSTLPSPTKRWGYGEFGDIRIGRKIVPRRRLRSYLGGKS